MNFNVKSISFLLFICLTISLNTIQAQRGGKQMTAKERAAKQTERMTEQLGLSEAQAADVAAINLKYTERAESLRTNGKDREANRAAMETMRAEQNTELKTILTPQQITKLDNMSKKTRGGGRGKNMSYSDSSSNVQRAEEKAARLSAELGLSDKQTARVSATLYSYEKTMQELKNTKATGESINKSDIETARDIRDAKLKRILTIDQLEQLEVLKAEKYSRSSKS